MCRKFLLIFSVLVLGLATNAWAQAVANQDIGNPAIAGGVTTDGVTWNITGAGADIWGSWDQFHFVFRPLAGDGSGIVRVVSADCTYQWAKYGVMIRETLDGDSKHAAIAMTPEHGAQSLWRQETGGGSASAELAGVALPLYLKIERVGDVIMTAATWDLAFWIPQQTLTIPMNETVYIGMFVGSVSADTACTAVFDSVDLTAPEYNLAWNVSPADGLLVTDPEAGVTLSWMPGDTAASHNVHLGTTSPPDLAVNQTETTYNTGPLEGGQTYYWRIDEVEADGTTIHEGEERSFNTLRPGTGTILYERWEGIGDVVVPALTNDPRYPASPTYTTELTTFEAPLDIMDNYGARMIGWLNPETSGDYTFWISADDYAELHLSSTESPVDAEIIANVPGWTSSREWGKYAEQQSAPVSLTGGDKYYVMGIFKEGGGGDNCAVAWEGPDSPTMSIIDGYYLSPFENLWAWGPNPADGATVVGISPTLSWQPAVDAVSYDVYVDGALLGNTTETSVTAGPFDLGSTHTWRVDVVTNSPARTGMTWGFTVANYRVIDDFESYDVVPEGTAPQFPVGVVAAEPIPSQDVVGGDYTIDETVGLVGYYPLNGDTLDASGSGHDGTAAGDPCYVDGPADLGTGLLFTPASGDDYVDLGTWDPSEGTGQLSVSLWLNWNGISGEWMGLIGKRDNWAQDDMMWHIEAAQGDGNIGVSRHSGQTVGGYGIPEIGVWEHLAFTFDGTTGKLYRDGAEAGSGAWSLGPDTESMLVFGCDNSTGWNAWNGALDEVRLYNRGLSNEEVQYLAGVGPQYIPPIYGPLRLHAELEGDLTDSSGNGNDGTMVGGDPVFEAGLMGQAIHLDGADDYVEFGDVGISGRDPRTVAAWVKADVLVSDLPNWINIFGFTGPSGCDGHFDLEIVESYATRGYGIHVYCWERVIMPVDYEWHHLAASYDGTTIRWYGDGGLVGADSSRVLNTPDNVHMGKRFDNANYFPGMVDDARIYDYALSQGEILGASGIGDLPPLYGPMAAHYKLDGDVTDSSGNGTDGAFMGGDPQFVPGILGDALDLDGVDDFVDFALPTVWPIGTAPRTMCGWAKTDTVADGYRWIAAYGASGTGQAMFIGQYGRALVAGGYGDDIWLDNYWDTDTWHHVCLTYDGATARLYWDGVAASSAGKNWNLLMMRAHIGRQVNNAAEFWDGPVDDVRIYDYALSAAQVAGLAGRAAENPITDTWSEWGLVDVSLDSNKAMRLDTYGLPGLPYYVGEVSRAVPFADLTAGGGKALDVWFSGDPANSASVMYAALTDGDGASDTVLYNGDLATTEWQVWHIDMRDFEGVDESNASEIAIGLAGLDGGILGDVMLIDDIRVYASRCVPDLAKPTYDLNNDCVVDIADLEILIGEWGRQSPAPDWDWDHRAAYWDSRYPFNWGGDGVAVRNALAAAGYTVLNADQLKAWMDARIADGESSVVVICRDSAPDTVAENNDANCTLRRYLDAGGKVVWFSDIPFYYQGHSNGTQTTWGTDGQAGILGIGALAQWDSWNTVTITDAGAAWGLTQTWSSLRAEDAGDVDVVLATDDSGNAPAYVKHYVPDDEFRGFVRLWDQNTAPHVADVIRAAEYPVLANDLNGDGKIGWADVFVMLDEWLDEVLWPY